MSKITKLFIGAFIGLLVGTALYVGYVMWWAVSMQTPTFDVNSVAPFFLLGGAIFGAIAKYND
jgi:hypothetical protein